VNSSPPRRTSIAKRLRTKSSTAAIVVNSAIRPTFRVRIRRYPARSPAAAAVDSAGNAASAKEIPMTVTGTLWKLRAKLTELIPPTASVDARALSWRNVRGSIGWLAILGSISLPNWRMAGIRSRIAGRSRTVVRRMPTTRTPRWSTAPRIAPTAGPKIPILGARRIVPATSPAL
jgi:hypothetical protein